MANLTFIAGGRRRRLYRRKMQDGSMSESYYVRVQIKGRDLPRSLGTNCPSAAKEKAIVLIEAEMKGDKETSRRLKMKSDYCTLQQVAVIYIEKFGTDDRRRRTANGNVGCLEKLVRIGAAGDLDSRSTILTGAAIRKLEQEELKRVKRDARGNMDQESERSVRESICSVVRQARSIFKPETLNWFESLALPNLDEFRRQGVTAPDRPKPKPLDEAAIREINAAAPLLARRDPSCYISHLLFKYLGLRNREQKFARRPWIVRDKDGAGQIGIVQRDEEGFKPKKSERWVPIAAAVLAEIDKYWKLSPDGDYLVPALHATERAEIIDDRHSEWAKQWIKGHIKVSYELRRYAGNLIYDKTGRIEDVRDFLGHSDLKTTLDWYFWKRRRIPAIDLIDCLAAPASPFAIVA
jgi:integrase